VPVLKVWSIQIKHLRHLVSNSGEHSNVARLYRAMPTENPDAGLLTFYIPGIGTPFREIGDEGGDWKAAVAWGGQARLDWAWARLEEQIAKAAARASNPVNKICMINVAVFGFSRGAALARAFAVKLQAACQRQGQGWVFTKGQYPIRLYFMGLFDTVASVGIPTAARKYQREASVAGHVLGKIPGLGPVLKPLPARVRHQNADFAFLVKPFPCESTTYAHFCGSFVVATA